MYNYTVKPSIWGSNEVIFIFPQFSLWCILVLWTVFTIVIPSVSELTVGVAPVGLVFVVMCVTVGLVFVVMCVTVGLVFVGMCVTVGLVFVVVCVAVGLVFVVVCVTVGLVLAVVFVAVGLLGVPLMGS